MTKTSPGGAPDTSGESRTVFLANLPRIERIAQVIGSRQGLAPPDVEDFVGWVRLRLLENDCAVLRKFSGRSSLGTYLTVVVANLFRDYRIRQRGRWRSSAAARRLGPVAERLERLIHGQRYTFREAAATIRSECDSAISDRELAILLGRLPIRAPLRPVVTGDDALATAPAATSADAALEAESERAERDTLRGELARALAAVPAEDRLILQLRFWDGLSIAEIARVLRTDQKPLYRRTERLLRRLRTHLLDAGIEPTAALACMRAVAESGDFADTGPSRNAG